MKIENAIWFTLRTGELLGIVTGTDDMTSEPKAYIGIADGIHERIDMDIICKSGCKISPGDVQKLHQHFLKKGLGNE